VTDAERVLEVSWVVELERDSVSCDLLSDPDCVISVDSVADRVTVGSLLSVWETVMEGEKDSDADPVHSSDVLTDTSPEMELEKLNDTDCVGETDTDLLKLIEPVSLVSFDKVTSETETEYEGEME